MMREKESPKTLLLFTFTHLDEMLSKGNVWYVRYYESYFDKVYVVYLSGDAHPAVKTGGTTLISLGAKNRIANMLLLPFKLYRLARKIKPDSFLTADQVFSWWTSLGLRLFLKAKVVLMPVSMPEEIYKNTGRSLSGLPIWLERISIYLSFSSADKILTGRCFGLFVEWLKKYPAAMNKLIVVDTLVEALPTEKFFTAITVNKGHLLENNVFNLVYVGRLHREKLVKDLILMMSDISKRDSLGKKIVLNFIGDGPERSMLEKLSLELSVAKSVRFLGYVPNERLPEYLLDADIFVSTLTGTALREAALCELPIVAYNMDWVVDLLKHEENALLIPKGSYGQMAEAVMRLLKDDELSKRLSMNAKALATDLWSPLKLRQSLARVFAD